MYILRKVYSYSYYHMSNLSLWTKVFYNYWTKSWVWIIVWKAFDSQPWIWTTYIIESKEILNDTYPYTHFVCPEIFLKVTE